MTSVHRLDSEGESTPENGPSPHGVSATGPDLHTNLIRIEPDWIETQRRRRGQAQRRLTALSTANDDDTVVQGFANVPPHNAAKPTERAGGPDGGNESVTAESQSGWFNQQVARVRSRITRAHVLALLVLAGVALIFAGVNLLAARDVPVVAAPVGIEMSQPGGESAQASDETVGNPVPPVSSTIVVHVLGEVNSPGVYELPIDSRVNDAISVAGGLTQQADPGELNLAGPLQDGQQVIIGSSAQPRGEVRNAQAPETANAVTGSSAQGSSNQSENTGTTNLINLNSASQDQLESLPGVGPVTAQKIIDFRQSSGGFATIGDLRQVSGIGPKSYERLAPLVTV